MSDATANFETPTPTTGGARRGDQLATMLFLAALFHGVLILGITFGDVELPKSAPATSMEVVLLTRDYEKRPDVSDAEYVAQQNLAGTGGTEVADGIRVAYGSGNDPAMPGLEQDGVETPVDTADLDTAEQLLYARTPDAGTLSEQRERAAEQVPVRTGMPGTANSVEILAAPDTETSLKGAQPRQLIISANTRESRIAAYLDGWKRRVERVGTMNFPRAALATGGQRNPVLEVNISADGSLQEALILATSGSRELDMAAVDILRMASPFDPFPEYLRNDYDELKFSYEWQFRGSTVGRMQVP